MASISKALLLFTFRHLGAVRMLSLIFSAWLALQEASTVSNTNLALVISNLIVVGAYLDNNRRLRNVERSGKLNAHTILKVSQNIYFMAMKLHPDNTDLIIAAMKETLKDAEKEATNGGGR